MLILIVIVVYLLDGNIGTSLHDVCPRCKGVAGFLIKYI